MRREYCAEKRFSVLVDLIVIYFVRHNLRNGDRLRTGGGGEGRVSTPRYFGGCVQLDSSNPGPFSDLACVSQFVPERFPTRKTISEANNSLPKKSIFDHFESKHFKVCENKEHNEFKVCTKKQPTICRKGIRK